MTSILNYDQLRQFNFTLGNEIVYVQGYASLGDGGQGLFFWDSTSTISDDDGIVIGSFTTGRWIRSYSDSINIQWFGATLQSLDNSAIFNSVISSLPANSTLYFPPGIWSGYLKVWRSDISIKGAGSSSTIIKIPDNAQYTVLNEAGTGTITGVPIVIDVGTCSRGNNAVEHSRVNVSGFTLDGNRDNTTEPLLDVFGWGISVTKSTYCNFEDIIIKDCYNGCGIFINSNFNKGVVTVINCGNEITRTNALDFNSSSFNTFTAIIKDCVDGVRILDNCWNNMVNATVYNSKYYAFIGGNQVANEGSFNNIITLAIYEGCITSTISVGTKFSNNIINAVARNTSGAMHIIAASSAANSPVNNTITYSSINCDYICAIIESDFNSYKLSSFNDGRTTTYGSEWAIKVYGTYNKIDVTVNDATTPLLRGLLIDENAENNDIVNMSIIGTVQSIADNAPNTNFTAFFGNGLVISSASVIAVPLRGNVFHISGTLGITEINATPNGRVFTLIFDNAVTIYNGNNLKLNGNFTARANSTLSLVYDGIYFYEKARVY